MSWKLTPRAVVFVLLVVLAGAWKLVSYYTDWLWFESLGLHPVFWRMLRARFASGAMFGVLAGLVVGVNLYFASRFTRHALAVGGSPFAEGEEIPGEQLLRSRGFYVAVAAALVLILGSIGAGQWALLLRYMHAQPFGITDPIFGKDVGFYVFSLPFYQFTAYFLLGALIVSTLAVGLVYAASGGIRFQERVVMMPRPLAHLSAVGGALLLVLAWIYRLKVYGLLYAQRAVAFGAGYADVNVQVWVYWLLVLAFLGLAGVLFMNVQRREFRVLFRSVGGAVGAAILVGSIPAAIVQKLVVEPSELERETPYIEYNIDATRRAYGLDRVEEKPFEASEALTRADIEANPLTLRNIRVWDEPPLMQSYQQIQEIRPYYVFNDVDVDRYTVGGVYRQVMLSGRELDTGRLPQQARNWVNERLQYTHGYGVAMSPVNRITPEGLPDLMLKDIPPVASHAELEVSQPEIYYGERTYAYVVVKTGVEEFDYPRGDENAFTTYQGTGGVRMGGVFGRLLFAMRFLDANLVLSTYLTPESRIMFQRQIRERVQTIAPFLFFDSDPYLVKSQGKLYWIIDAYTTTEMYPYSRRSGRSGINYIRNSVKVVVDAYNGSVAFYRVNLKDPIVEAYAEIFPGLFRPLDSMPEELRAHVRYPIDLFRIQAARYMDYHMQDVQVFYNQEDLWSIPNEVYSDQPQMMEPYYIIIKLPGETREEFLLMVPYTPANRDNMIAWLAARCDGENYGHLLVYKLPKDKLIYGPMQIEARVNQQPDIASQFTLWGQRGSQVIRGNLLAIPIEQSFLYVEPVYLRARSEPEVQGPPAGQGGEEQPQRRGTPQRQEQRSIALPELKQVILAFGGRVVMRPTLSEALKELFGEEREISVVQEEEAAVGMAEAVGAAGEPAAVRQAGAPVQAASLAERAEVHYRKAREAMQAWNWGRAGEEMKALEQTIEELRKALAEGK